MGYARAGEVQATVAAWHRGEGSGCIDTRGGLDGTTATASRSSEKPFIRRSNGAAGESMAETSLAVLGTETAVLGGGF